MVLRVRRGDVERVDLVVGHDLGVRPVRPVDPELVREGLRPVGGSAGHRDHRAPGMWGKSGNTQAAIPPGPTMPQRISDGQRINPSL